MAAPARIAILAKAPIAGFAKTRLIPALGERGAARLQRTLTLATVRVATQAGLGQVTVWCAPDAGHRFFRALGQCGVACADQPDGTLGDRMLRAAGPAVHGGPPAGPVLIIGTDCPALRPHHLQQANEALQRGSDAVVIPAEDGGYVLIGLQCPQPGLFSGIDWSTPAVMAQTRERAAALGLHMTELAELWDVDTPGDLSRMRQLEYFHDLPEKPTP